MGEKKLAKNFSRVTRKFSREQKEKFERAREEVMKEVPPKPVSPTRVIVAKLKSLRLRLGLSLADVAKRTGMTAPNLSRLEKERDNATLETLRRYADALDCDVVIDLRQRSPRGGETACATVASPVDQFAKTTVRTTASQRAKRQGPAAG